MPILRNRRLDDLDARIVRQHLAIDRENRCAVSAPWKFRGVDAARKFVVTLLVLVDEIFDVRDIQLCQFFRLLLAQPAGRQRIHHHIQILRWLRIFAAAEIGGVVFHHGRMLTLVERIACLDHDRYDEESFHNAAPMNNV
jgi:hypothetical protein